jgi:hypothetical protein
VLGHFEQDAGSRDFISLLRADKTPDVMTMESKQLTARHLRTRLRTNHHRCHRSDYDPEGVRVRPREEMIITVALNEDYTLLDRFRRRFFLCEPEPESILLRAGCPEGIRRRWIKLAMNVHGWWHYILAGPGSWVLSRLYRYDRLTLWGNYGTLGRANYVQRMFERESAALRNALPASLPLRDDKDLVILRLRRRDPRFVYVLAASFLMASMEENCYIAGDDFAEVYTLHHHDMVMASIPRVVSRHEVLRHFMENADVYEDVSGYLDLDHS